MPTLGMVGTGHLASYLITGLRRGGHTGRVLLTPRNADYAAALARDAGCEVAESSQAVVDGADIVVISVRPQYAEDALAGLTWSGQTVVSVMAGIGRDRVAELVPGAGEVHLMMPLSYLAFEPGPIPFYPGSAELADLFGAAGDIVALPDQRAYDAAMIASCASSWVYDLAGALADELAQHGLAPDAARQLALACLAGPAAEARARPDDSLAAIADSIATEGTYSKLGRDLVHEREFDEPWRAAIRAIAAQVDGVQ